MLTVTFIAIAQGSASGGQIGLLIVKQMLFGIFFWWVDRSSCSAAVEKN